MIAGFKSKAELMRENVALKKLLDLRFVELMPSPENKEEFDEVVEDLIFFLSCRRYYINRKKRVNRL